jgi:SAM-dependent methyltransferase
LLTIIEEILGKTSPFTQSHRKQAHGTRFDIIHGLGILHHVGLDAGLREVHRILKPGGYAVFFEPLGNSRIVEACKRRIHSLLDRRLSLTRVTSGEEPLRLADVRRACQTFSVVEIYPFHLIYRVRKLILPKWAYDSARMFDYQVIRTLPFLAYFAGAAVIYIRK